MTDENKTVHTAFVGFGSNLGDGQRTLADAWLRLGEEDQIDLTILSSPFLSDPLGMESENRFTNCVGRIETTLSPANLLGRLLAIEQEFGRDRSSAQQGMQDRTLDLDILYFSTLIFKEEDLTIPHPRIGERLFALVPMVEIEPTYVDPVAGKSVVNICKDFYAHMREGVISLQTIERAIWKEGLFGPEERSFKIA